MASVQAVHEALIAAWLALDPKWSARLLRASCQFLFCALCHIWFEEQQFACKKNVYTYMLGESNLCLIHLSLLYFLICIFMYGPKILQGVNAIESLQTVFTLAETMTSCSGDFDFNLKQSDTDMAYGVCFEFQFSSFERNTCDRALHRMLWNAPSRTMPAIFPSWFLEILYPTPINRHKDLHIGGLGASVLTVADWVSS